MLRADNLSNQNISISHKTDKVSTRNDTLSKKSINLSFRNDKLSARSPLRSIRPFIIWGGPHIDMGAGYFEVA